MGLKELIETSRSYGRDPKFVLAGGGNTSFKDETSLFIKASGTTLAEITENGMVQMDRSRLGAIWTRRYSTDPDERERQALADLMASRAEGETKRPSVETLLHDLLRPQYVVHLHPALVNGLTCGGAGERIAFELYPQGMLWIPVVNPGYVLANHIRGAIESHLGRGEEYPKVIFLQNHGVFVTSHSLEEIDAIYRRMIEMLSERLLRTPEVGQGSVETDALLGETAERLSTILGRIGKETVAHPIAIAEPEVKRLVGSEGSFSALKSFGYTPDHLVYCKAAPVWISASVAREKNEEAIEQRIVRFTEEYGALPRVFAVEGRGVVVIGDTDSVVENAAALFLDLVKLVTYAESFGGPRLMPKDKIDFILNWEVESYRSKVGQREE